jgi:hypothetical protein
LQGTWISKKYLILFQDLINFTSIILFSLMIPSIFILMAIGDSSRISTFKLRIR